MIRSYATYLPKPYAAGPAALHRGFPLAVSIGTTTTVRNRPEGATQLPALGNAQGSHVTLNAE